jgi:AraC-like DNA-binding protein
VHPSNGIIFFIEQNNFDNMVKDVLSENGEFLLLNANEMIVYNKQNHSEDSFFDIAQILVRNKDSRESLHSETINGEKYLVVKVISEYYNWTYINFIPEKQYMHQISYIQNLFYIIIFAVLLVMIGLSYLSAYGNYRPLNEIVKQIVTSKDIELTESQKKSNEFSCIIQAFNELNKENQNLITRLREMIDTLKEFILIKIIKQGNLSSDELLEFKNTFGVNHIGKSFCVFSILFDMQEDKSEYIPYNKIRKKVIADIENFQEIDNVFTLFLTEDKGIAVLLIINKIDNNLIQKIAEQMRETIKYSFDFTATIGVGEICNSMQDINVSYKQSYEAAKYRLIRGGDTVINYSEFKELRVIGYETLIERCSELVSAIKNADRERVTEELDSIVQEIICHKHSIQTLQLISVNIFHKVIDMLNEAKIKPERNIIKPIEQVISMEIDSIEEFQKNVTEFCMGVCEKLDNKVSGKSAILKRSIEVYLKDNFRDADLSLTKIGDDLNMSPAYLTTFFKEQTGKSIMAYVEKLRIGQAKQLLRSTDLKIKDITRQVGFIDEGTFSRNFKKHEHITPTQYRSLMTEENTEAKMGKQH